MALHGEAIVGYAAVSPVSIAGSAGWFGLGPVAVRPDRQGEGIGSELVIAALERLKAAGASGCVVIGDPGYYGRFGFAPEPGLSYADILAPYVQAVSFGDPVPQGDVVYHPAFAG